jgi:hypothetical protein
MATTDLGLDLGRYKLGWSDAEDYVFKPKRGLTEDIIKEMSWMKGEPDWMRDIRLKSYQHFLRRPMPSWGGDMSEIFFDAVVISSIVRTTSPTTTPPRTATSEAPIASWLACFAFSLFCFTVEVSSSMLEAVSCRLADCSSVRCDRSVLPLAISLAAVSMMPVA